MKIKGEDLETAKKLWHPDQHVNVYELVTGVFCFNADLKEIDPEDGGDFAEPVDEDGQPCKPRLKNEQ